MVYLAELLCSSCSGSVQFSSVQSLSRVRLFVTPHGSAGEYQADEQAGVMGLSWRVSGR